MMNGGGIDNPDLIYAGQKILIPKTFRRPLGWAARPVHPKRIGRPGKLKEAVRNISVPVAALRWIDGFKPAVKGSTTPPVGAPKSKLELETPLMVIKEPGFTATISFTGQVLIQLAHAAPLTMLSTGGMEMAFESSADHVRDQLLSESDVSWDGKSTNVQFTCNMIKHAIAPGIPKIHVGGGAAYDKPVPVLHIELEYPPLSGILQSNYYYAENFRVSMDLEPDVPLDEPGKPKDVIHINSINSAAKIAGAMGLLTIIGCAANRLAGYIYTFLLAASDAAGSGVLPFVILPPGEVRNGPPQA
jgi:hypothetical protein